MQSHGAIAREIVAESGPQAFEHSYSLSSDPPALAKEKALTTRSRPQKAPKSLQETRPHGPRHVLQLRKPAPGARNAARTAARACTGVYDERGNIARGRRLAKRATPRTIDSPPPLPARTSKGTAHDCRDTSTRRTPGAVHPQAVTPLRSSPGTAPAPAPRPSAYGAGPPGRPSRGDPVRIHPE